MNLREYATCQERRLALEKELDITLPGIGNFTLDEKQASSKNCENMIGCVQVPIGIAGPLKIKDEEFYIPLATTEGALVASVNRGARAIGQGNGVQVICKKVGITRAPVFSVTNLQTGEELVRFVTAQFGALSEITAKTSSHLQLLEIKPWQVGRNVFLRFRFDSMDAMGMNMATIAVTKACEYIEAQTTARLVSVSGNMCTDKKPNFLGFIEGRGYSVSAEAVIDSETLASILKTNYTDLYEVANRKLMIGSILSGSIGANAQYANVLSALFLATGQDIAHVAESAAGITTVEKEKDGIYISVYLPDLVVGTIGGGTMLQTQQESLSIMGIKGASEGQHAIKFAGIIAGAVLAGELSLLSSLAENSLSSAHIRLGRGEK